MAEVAAYRRTPDTLSKAEQLFVGCRTRRDIERRIRAFTRDLPATTVEAMPYTWSWWARPQQLPPAGPWSTWMIRAGRGFGKTRTGAEAVRRRVRKGLAGHVTLIAPTAGDARDVMIEGESGLLAVHPPHWRPVYEPSKRRLTWPNGAVGTAFSAEEPDRLRGPQSDLVWADEPASYKTGATAWDNAMLGLRLGSDPRGIITMTPRALDWLKALEARASTVVTRGSTYDNIANLAETFIELVLERYEGTRLGAQELHAEYLEDVEGALWRLAVIEATRIGAWDRADPWGSIRREINAARLRLALPMVTIPADRRPWHVRIGVDPPGETAECGIVVAAAPHNARAGRDHGVVLADMSVAGPPEVWGARVAEAFHLWDAECCVVEANQGGDMCRSTIHAADSNVVVRKIRAKASKLDRAEPVSVQYAKGWWHHVGHLPMLENQLTTWVPTEGKSPDRLDAMVHVCTDLIPPAAVGRGTISSPLGRRIA